MSQINNIKSYTCKFAILQATTHGLALQLRDESALEYLNRREVTLGGYVSHITMFYPRDKSRAPFPVLLYVATPSNKDWLGPAPLPSLAEQVYLHHKFDPMLARQSSVYNHKTCKKSLKEVAFFHIQSGA